MECIFSKDLYFYKDNKFYQYKCKSLMSEVLSVGFTLQLLINEVDLLLPITGTKILPAKFCTCESFTI